MKEPQLPSQPVEQREQPRWNLRTNYEATVRAMGDVEGNEAWTKIDQRDATTDYTTRGALEHLRQLDEDGDETEDVSPIVYTVHGSFGVSRWYVRRNGEVLFSESHDPEKAKKAVALGFKTK